MKNSWSVLLVLVVISQTGCASFNRKLKNFLGGGDSARPEASKQANTTRFSDSQDEVPRVRRQYKRTTKESLADQSALDSHAGSLWVMEGQGAYLFSQNTVRLVGDPLAVTIDGDPRDQLQSKVGVIKTLLSRIEEKQRARQLASAEREDNSDKDEKPEKAKGDKKKDRNTGKSDNNASEHASAPASDATPDLSVKTVPTRVVERTLDGNYRVKGSQPFLIGNREYKVIVTGVVRAEEFNDEGISASKLLDPKFDIVSARRKEGEM